MLSKDLDILEEKSEQEEEGQLTNDGFKNIKFKMQKAAIQNEQKSQKPPRGKDGIQMSNNYSNLKTTA